MFKYFPHTKQDIELMLKELNISSIDELFAAVPKEVLLDHEYDLPSEMSEMEVRNYLKTLSDKNQELLIFSGLGLYDHYTPSVIDAITSRQEFLTSYTPYQPEVSQGTLQYIFEYQSMIQSLTGLDVSNASMYDGTTAAAEACFMACSISRRNKILISSTMHPSAIQVIKTYLRFKGHEFEMVPAKDGVLDQDALSGMLDKEVAGLIVQNPNFFGLIESYDGLADLLHENKSIFIQHGDISALGVLKTPGENGADIACGDCQSLGMPLSFGGPTIGYLATIKKHVRKMPGRICGYTTDTFGNRAFVLTLQAREQHIRRAKANSNICSNQSLLVLYSTVYLSIMGKQGIKEVNSLSYQNAHYLYDQLLKTKKFFDPFQQPFLKEFTLETTLSHDLIKEALLANGIFGGFSLSGFSDDYENLINFAVTEKRTKAEIDKLLSVLEGLS
ncbi:MAG: aminomethyl-transferring glycine dehydrogenase subunit GcvPA [Bacilli bacterium]|nr:aminomethyl-transferring glycine dehydrogenase subunit GcvPA [Bacilli bacterium]MBN2877125.1 aminomethyl-transferring glycine dehydrogenase subunit GcvPA [Bacilli bacterium]